MAAVIAQRFTIHSRTDVEQVLRATRALVASLGFEVDRRESVCLAVSELATNLLRYAPGGTILLSVPDDESARSILVESVDRGPGIPDVERALQDGYSSGGSLGAGLGAVRRLMDEFAMTSGPGGTTIVARKWSTPRS
jgi:serine/threonine-protein kinase RsbT